MNLNLDDLLDSKFIKKKESFEFSPKNHEEHKELQDCRSPKFNSPGLRKKPGKISDFYIQKVQVNLSINTKKPKKRSSNQMVQSMMPTVSPKKATFNENKSPFLRKEKCIATKPQTQRSFTRHQSLTYSKRNKYVSDGGKSTILSKVIRPESNDNSLIYIEHNFGKIDSQMMCQSPGLKGLSSSKNSKGGPSNGKSKSGFANRCKQSLRKENDLSELLLTIRKSTYNNEDENNPRKGTLDEEEVEEDTSAKLEQEAV